jgi:hypothetical protein
MDKRYGRVQWGPHGEREGTSEDNWKNPNSLESRGGKDRSAISRILRFASRLVR